MYAIALDEKIIQIYSAVKSIAFICIKKFKVLYI